MNKEFSGAGLMNGIDRALGVCDQVFYVLANICLILMLALNTINIASRAIFDIGINFVFPWTLVLFTWMTFLGFYVIYRRQKDITIDFVVDKLGPNAKAFSRHLVNLVVICLMIVMLVHAPSILSRQVGDIEMVGIQRFWLSVPLFASCALILVRFLAEMTRAILGLPESKPNEPPLDGI